MYTNSLIISYILQSYPSKWAISVTEIHCPKEAVPKLNSSSRTIYVMDLLTLKRLTLHFTNLLVNEAFKFYVVSLTLYNFNF